MATVYLLPDSEGTVQQWVPYPVSDPVVHWDKVDDPVGSPDEGTTYVNTPTNNRIEDFNHQTSALLVGANITNVRVTVRVRKRIAGNAVTLNIGVRIGITRYAGITPIAITTRYANYVWDWPVSPAFPGNPWTKSDIDNLQSSLQSIVAGFLPVLSCTQVYITVTYTPGVTPVAGKGLISWTP